MTKRVAVCVMMGVLSACASTTAAPQASETAAKKPAAAASTTGGEQASASASATAAESAAPTASASASPADPSQPVPLPPQVDGGEISRPELLAVLSRGVGRFLQRVRVSAERDAQGRFAGWHIVSLFPGEALEPVVQAGDTLLRVNGQSVERPEQLKTVWDSLVSSSELVLTVRRAGQKSEIRYRIVEPASAASPQPASAAKPKRS